SHGRVGTTPKPPIRGDDGNDDRNHDRSHNHPDRQETPPAQNSLRRGPVAHGRRAHEPSRACALFLLRPLRLALIRTRVGRPVDPALVAQPVVLTTVLIARVWWLSADSDGCL